MANYNWPINPTTVNSGPVQFETDGVPTTVNIDTGTPANSTPLPVAILDPAGLPVDFATLTEQQVQTTVLNSIDGELVTLNAVDFATEAKQDAQILLETDIRTNTSDTAVNTADILTEVDAINTKLNSDFGASTGAIRTAAQIGNATGAADFGSGAAGTQTLRAVLASDSPSPVQPINTGSFAQITNLINSAQTLTAPAGAIGFKIQAPSTNTQNIAFSIGATATITAGILLEPGRSEDFDTGSNISVIATSATQQVVSIIWKVRP